MPTDRLTRDSLRLSKLFLWALVVAVGFTIIMAIASLTTPSFYFDFEELSGAGMLVCLFCVQALGCAVVAEHGRAVGFMRSGIVAGAFALAGWLAIVFYVSRPDELLWMKVVTWPTTWACLMLVAGVLLLPRVRVRWWRSLRMATIVLLEMLSAHIALAVTFAPGYSWRYQEMAYRIGAAIALLAAGGIVTTFITAWTLRLSGAAGSQRESVRFWLTCPRCGAEQQALTEGYACRQCRLRIRVQRP